MKQKLFEIPVWEAFQLENCECALCAMEKSSEEKLITTLFAEMIMDVRLNPQLVEEFDFCQNHIEKLYRYPDKCGLAVLTNRLLYSKRQKLKINEDFTKNPHRFPFKRFISKKNISTNIEIATDCLICKKLSNVLNNYEETLINLWVKDEDFRAIYASSRGFCLKHFNILMEHSKLLIKDINKQNEFIIMTTELQEQNLKRLQEELEWFISKFDYRFADQPWKTSKDSLIRTIQKLVGNFNSKI